MILQFGLNVHLHKTIKYLNQSKLGASVFICLFYPGAWPRRSNYREVALTADNGVTSIMIFLFFLDAIASHALVMTRCQV